MTKISSVYKKIEHLRRRFCEIAPKNASLLKLLDETEVAEQVYNSNAIENSTLSLEETEKLLLQIDLDRFISEREIFEAKNLARVVFYIRDKAKAQELDRDMILFLHKMLLSNIRDDVAGRFRNDNEWVRVANHIAVDPQKIIGKIDEMFVEYNSTYNKNIIKRIALLHLQFENIHPFVDGNGRIGRVINNYLLRREGFVPINIKFIDRRLYYDAFNDFDISGKTLIMEEIVGKALTSSYHKRLAYMERKEIVKLSEYAKKTKKSHSNLINKAKRQTIEAFLEKNVWKIGI
ncbi:MAG: Fic family protein [Verrucomicrobiota bacterium]|nr:Fic family protein [Verrucomicrobiota bacterium]